MSRSDRRFIEENWSISRRVHLLLRHSQGNQSSFSPRFLLPSFFSFTRLISPRRHLSTPVAAPSFQASRTGCASLWHSFFLFFFYFLISFFSLSLREKKASTAIGRNLQRQPRDSDLIESDMYASLSLLMVERRRRQREGRLMLMTSCIWVTVSKYDRNVFIPSNS